VDLTAKRACGGGQVRDFSHPSSAEPTEPQPGAGWTGAAASRPAGSRATRSAADPGPVLPGGRRRLTSTVPPEDLSELYSVLVDADDQGDAPALGRLGWTLFTMASTARQAYDEAAGLLDELRAASRAAVAGDGSPGSLALLRHVLTRHGWLPLPNATPLQALSAPEAADSLDPA
jgi:hypothetical protein